MSLSTSIICSLLFILFSSVLTSIENKCLSDTDCHSNFICNIQTKQCTCPKSYFWHRQLQICSRCPLNWLELTNTKCLFFDNYSLPTISFYQTKQICQSLLAQPIQIVHLNELNQIKDLLNQSLDIHQSVWININPTSINSSLWCNEKNKPNRFDCLQIRKDQKQNRICFEYISCLKPAYFICEFIPIKQNENIRARFARAVTTPRSRIPNLVATTKKPSRIDVNNAINQGVKVVDTVANVFTSIFGKKDTKEPEHPPSTNIIIPQALSEGDEDEDEGGGFMHKLSSLFSGAGIIIPILVIVVIIIIIIVIIVVCSKKKSSPSRHRSAQSTESSTSEAEYD